MTTTGQLLVETSNDDGFTAGATYAVTLVVDRRVSVVSASEVPTVIPASEAATSETAPDSESGSDSPDSEPVVEPTIPATA